MNPKRLLLSSTMAFAIAMSASGTWTSTAEASPVPSREANLPASASDDSPAKDELLCVLGTTDDELYDALYNGKSLADIAKRNQVEVTQVIDLQVAEMTELLNARLSSGSLTPADYEAQKSELREIITRSVHGGASSD